MGPAYYRAILRGEPRYDLDGNPCGEVTPEEREKAKQNLRAFFERRKRKKAPLAPVPLEDTPGPGVGENKV
jgi:sRNA-binding protein